MAARTPIVSPVGAASAPRYPVEPIATWRSLLQQVDAVVGAASAPRLGPCRRQYCGANITGFTLPELVIVLVIIGILAAFAAPRLDVTGFERQIFADELTNGLRHARKVALNSGCPVGVVASAASDSVSADYTGIGGTACSGPLPHPTRGGAFVLNGEITTGANFTFDALGRSGGGQIVTASGDVIFIEPGTGYVHR